MVSQEVRRLWLTAVSRIIAILVVSKERLGGVPGGSGREPGGSEGVLEPSWARPGGVLGASGRALEFEGAWVRGGMGSKAVFDDCFEDRSDFGGSARGSKAVFADSLEDRSDLDGFAGRFEGCFCRQSRGL